MPRRSNPKTAVTRDLKRIRALTKQVQLPDVDEQTRQRLRSMSLTARVRFDAGDLSGALAALCEA